MNNLIKLIKIDTSVLPINKKSVEVNVTGDMADAGRLVLKEALEIQEVKPNESYLQYIDRQIALKKDELELLKTVLSLTEAQIKKINKELPETKIDNYSAYVTTVLQGMTTGSYADFEAEQDDSEDASDPKKQENAD